MPQYAGRHSELASIAHMNLIAATVQDQHGLLKTWDSFEYGQKRGIKIEAYRRRRDAATPLRRADSPSFLDECLLASRAITNERRRHCILDRVALVELAIGFYLCEGYQRESSHTSPASFLDARKSG